MKTIKLEGQVIDPYLVSLYEFEGVPYITSRTVKAQLDTAAGEDLLVQLYSSGGNVFEGIEIANAIKNYAGRVEVVITSLAASIATVIASAADKVTMQQGSLYMIHQPAVGLGGMYDTDDLAKETNAVEGCKQSIISFYQARTGLSEDKLSELMSAESWLTPKEALDYGFVDEIAEGAVQVAASADEMVQIYENKIRKDNDLNNKLLDKLKNLLSVDTEEVEAEATQEVEAEATETVEADTTEAEATEAPEAAEAETAEEQEAEVEQEAEAADEAEAEDEVSDNAEDYAALLEKAVNEIERLKSDNAKLTEQVNNLAAKKEETNNKKAEAEAVINKLNALLSSDNEKLVVVNTENKKEEVKGRFEHQHI